MILDWQQLHDPYSQGNAGWFWPLWYNATVWYKINYWSTGVAYNPKWGLKFPILSNINKMVIATPTPLERNKRVVTINEKKNIERNWAVRVHIWVGPVEARVEQSRNGLGWIYPKALARALSHRRRATNLFLQRRCTGRNPKPSNHQYIAIPVSDTARYVDTLRYVTIRRFKI